MAKASALDFLYSKKKSPLEFNFDRLTAPPLLSLLTHQDIYQLNQIARSVKLASKIDEKYKLIDNIMTTRGFVKLHAGTNRVVYRFIEDQRFVVKIAVDRVGLGDNPAEFKNQFLLKPFVTKIFEVSPCGTVALVERVNAVMSREEFASIADDVFNLITKVFVGKYILEDFGSWYFMNYGIRNNGGGPVLLDFPYVYELDGNKLYCNKPMPFDRNIRCGGELDYDDGFNNLVCTKCGKHYHARDLKKAEKEELIIVGGKKTMKVMVKTGNKVIVDSSKKQMAKVIEPEPVVNIPKDTIFHREENVEQIEEPEVKFEADTYDKYTIPFDQSECMPNLGHIVEPEVLNEAEDEEDTLEEQVKATLEETEEEDEYEEDVEDYEQYLSNRERSNMKKEKKHQSKGNTDFGGF